MHTALTQPVPGAQAIRGQTLIAPPATAAMRAGSVILEPLQDVGEHSTNAREEVIVVLEGRGQLRLPDACLDLSSPCVAYVPPHTSHNVVNTDEHGALRYVYVVAPAPADQGP